MVTCTHCKKAITTQADLTVGLFIIPLAYHDGCFSNRTKSFLGFFLKDTPVNTLRYTLLSLAILIFGGFMYTTAFLSGQVPPIFAIAPIIFILIIIFPRLYSYFAYETKLPKGKAAQVTLQLTNNCAYCQQPLTTIVTARTLFGTTVYPFHDQCFTKAIKSRSRPLLASLPINSKQFTIGYYWGRGLLAFFSIILLVSIIFTTLDGNYLDAIIPSLFFLAFTTATIFLTIVKQKSDKLLTNQKTPP